MSETNKIAEIARQRMPKSVKPKKYPAYRASTTAMAAKIPACITQNIPHPHRNASAGEYMRFRKTYTPPVSGNNQLSSAHTSAAQSVNKPETSHARITPRPSGTSRTISVGCTKMNAPTIIPTTIAVAVVGPMERLSSVDMECVKAARFYHAPSINLLWPSCVEHRRLKVHRDACHVAGNKGAGSGPARSNVTILVNRSVSLHSFRRASQCDRKNASIHAVKTRSQRTARTQTVAY